MKKQRASERLNLLAQHLLRWKWGMMITMPDSLKPRKQDAFLDALGKAVESLAK